MTYALYPDQPVHPWDRLDNENAEQYRAFASYLYLPFHKRSLNNAYWDAYPDRRGRPCTTRWREWSRTFNWEERAVEYDVWRREKQLKQKAQHRADTTALAWESLHETIHILNDRIRDMADGNNIKYVAQLRQVLESLDTDLTPTEITEEVTVEGGPVPYSDPWLNKGESDG